MASVAGRCALEKAGSIVDELYLPLVHGAVISYTRPFSKNRPLGAIRPRIPGNLRPAHKALRRLRNRAVAHSDLVDRSIWIHPPGLPSGQNGHLSTSLGYSVSVPLADPRLLESMLRLTDVLLPDLEAKIDELLHKLFSGANEPPDRMLLETSAGARRPTRCPPEIGTVREMLRPLAVRGRRE
jgi:hypothetical protein